MNNSMSIEMIIGHGMNMYRTKIESKTQRTIVICACRDMTTQSAKEHSKR